MRMRDVLPVLSVFEEINAVLTVRYVHVRLYVISP